MPCALLIFFVLPDYPTSPKKWYLTEEEMELARARMARIKRVQTNGIMNATVLKRIFSRWRESFSCSRTEPKIDHKLRRVLAAGGIHLLRTRGQSMPNLVYSSFVLMKLAQCQDTAYFAIWLSMCRFTAE